MCERERRQAGEKFHILSTSGKPNKNALKSICAADLVFDRKLPECLVHLLFLMREWEQLEGVAAQRRREGRDGVYEYDMTACRMWFTSDTCGVRACCV